jgi:hypothetical protein
VPRSSGRDPVAGVGRDFHDFGRDSHAISPRRMGGPHALGWGRGCGRGPAEKHADGVERRSPSPPVGRAPAD